MPSVTPALAFSAIALMVAQACASTPAFINELEHLLVDTGGYNDGGFKAGVTPCSYYNQGSQNSGRQSAAQWVRVAFHDFAPANVALGTGGMDASLGFETDRDENHGAAMNDSLTFFAPFVNKYASMADMIALGTVIAVGACSGPLIPFKGGRVDATEGGALGVPEQFGTLETHLEQFARAGLNQVEMIELVACGHTIGSVHQAGFPDVVQNAETPNNTNGGVHFDDTFDVYDNHVVTGYLDGTTTNPLVTTFNVTDRSDLRIFSSDGNVTMKKLAKSNNAFLSTCTTVMGKMLNTVPRGVQLTVVNPMALKPVDVQLSFDSNGTMVFSGSIRLLSSMGFPENSKRSVLITYSPRDGSYCSYCATLATYDPSSTKGSSLFGDTYYHLFSTPIDSSRGISSYTVTIYESPVAYFPSAVETFSIQDTAMWLSGFSNIAESNDAIIGTISAAVRTASKPSVVHAFLNTPLDQIGAKNPKVGNFTIPLIAQGALGKSGYTLYSSTSDAVLPIKNMTTALRSTVDIVAVSGGKSYIDDFRKLSALGA